MPAFDPVRDAALNSPVVQTQPLLPSPRPAFDPRSPTPILTQNGPFPPTKSESTPNISLGRRATDLSVLLNTDSSVTSPLRTPSSATRPSTLSHLLLPADDKLTTSEPFQRTNTQDEQQISRSSSRKLSSSSLFSPTQPSPISGYFPIGSPQTRSPLVSAVSRPSSSSSSYTSPYSIATPSTTISPVMPPPRNSEPSIPYNPRKRITPAGSVLIPMTPAEMEMYKNYRGIGAQQLLKRKRGRSQGLDNDNDQRPVKKLAGDLGVVVDHYNMRPDVGVKQRQDSPIIGLKAFNNWVKSVLITRFAHPVLSSSSTSNKYSSARGRNGGAGKVLDMGCGKGGDLTKWSKAKVREVIAVDIADVSVDQARNRWEQMRRPRFDAHFAALDCYSESLAKAFSPALLAQPFDVVSMQFCMHYAFENVQKARCMLDNVSRWLRPGGVFIGTIPNADQLLEHLDALPPNTRDLSFGNSVYKIRFEERNKRPIFGHKYTFFLQDAVENVPEYVVRWDNFQQMAAEYGLRVLYKEEFHSIFAEHQDHDEFGELLIRMKVVDSNGESAMDEDQWEAANIYIGFAFEKR